MTIPFDFHRHKTLIAFAAAMLVTFAVLVTGSCIYNTNDDMCMIRLLTGAQGIRNTKDAVFMSLPLSILLNKLYTVAPSIPFYGIFMYACLVCGCTIGCRTIFSAPATILPKLVVVTSFLGMYTQLVQQLNFAAVSLFLWFSVIAALSLEYVNENVSTGKGFIFCCLLGVSYLIRPDLLLLACAFSIPAVVTITLTKARKQFFVAVIPLILAILLANGLSLAYRSNEEHQAFRTFNEIRSNFVDTTLSAENPQTVTALARSGLSWPDYFMANMWWFHDGTVYGNTPLAVFLEHNNGNKGALLSGARSLGSITAYRGYLFIIILTLIPIIFSRDETPRNRKHDLLIVGTLLLTVTGLFLLSAIRLPPRVAIPLFIYVVLCGIIHRPSIAGAKINGKIKILSTTGICLAIIFLISMSNVRSRHKEALALKSVKLYSDSATRQVLELNGPDTIFLNVSPLNDCFSVQAANPLKEYRDIIAGNDFPYGWLIGSPAYNSFLRDNGFVDRQQVVPKMIDNDRLVLAYWDNGLARYDDLKILFQQHLLNRYSQLFQGKEIRLKVLLDCRNIAGKFGWVFFTMTTSS